MSDYKGHKIVKVDDEQRGDSYFEVKNSDGSTWLAIFTTEENAKESIDWKIANA